MLGIIQGLFAKVRGRLVHESIALLTDPNDGSIRWELTPVKIHYDSSSLPALDSETVLYASHYRVMCWDAFLFSEKDHENFLLSFITMLYILPFVIVTLANGTILLIHRLRPRYFDQINPRPSKVNRLLVTVVLTFGLCWGPIHLFTLLNHIYSSTFEELATNNFRTYSVIYLICHLLAMTHSILNPIVYCLVSKDLRVCVSIIFCQLHHGTNSFD